jgi:hypothetical protein
MRMPNNREIAFVAVLEASPIFGTEDESEAGGGGGGGGGLFVGRLYELDEDPYVRNKRNGVKVRVTKVISNVIAHTNKQSKQLI